LIAQGHAEAADRPGADAAAAALEITLVPVLAGSFIFVADLIRHLPMRLQIRMLAISSYPGAATQSRPAQVQRGLTNLPQTLEGRHVLIIDDILDSGGTLRMAVELLKERQPASLRTCVLLRKQRPQAMNFPVDYVAFDIPDEFIVGYGLDHNDYYRNLPDIVTLRPEVFSDL
jgi:hypoxanthine phosphoribosyltransferase